jgi:retron-type reverse transcriptase
MIEGDICKFFDNINHDTVIEILRGRIKDERFLSLILSGMKSGVILPQGIKLKEEGIAQGCPASPIIANIYLDKFDKYMETNINEFHKGVQRKRNNVITVLKNTNSEKYYKVLKHYPTRHQI